MSQRQKQILKYFQFKRIIIPIIIGLSVAAYLLYNNLTEERYELSTSENADYIWQDYNENVLPENDEFIKVSQGEGTHIKLTYKDVLGDIRWQKYSLIWIFMSLFLMAVRDFAYILRLRILTDNKLSWRQCFDSIMLWEFASAVTPSVVGGSAVAIFIINKEGISTGKSTAIVMITAFLDELFYIIMVPIVFLLVKHGSIFPEHTNFAIFNTFLSIKVVFIIGYSFILFLTSVILYAILFNPRGFKSLLIWVFKLRFLKKWQHLAEETGNDIILTSKEMKTKSLFFWLKAFGATFLSWTARFWVVNSLIMIFISVQDHFLIYARQLIMWVIILISPTPGSSGVAEFVFSDFLREFIPVGFSPAVALMWRLISYYPYLFIGVIILPHWLRKVYKRKKMMREQQSIKS
ncbi:MAG: lysylphosphatidylglycerol synthase transmembrane domain-containing protein [Bacteroidales bacterium]|nr:lysylphosphatidylglycerol synthase transmembrane domain-containing protein [Bacteroidales bacterium]